jgi:hypothetical protein
MGAHRDVLTEYHGRLLWEVKDLAARHRLADAAVELGWSGRRLRAEIDEHHRQREIEEWSLRGDGLPRHLSVSITGIRVRIDLRRADLDRAIEVLDRATQRLRSAAELRGGAGAD